MYIWLFSRSVGAGSATTRNTRGLTRSVIALIVPPLPAPSRPSNTMHDLEALGLHPFLELDELAVQPGAAFVAPSRVSVSVARLGTSAPFIACCGFHMLFHWLAAHVDKQLASPGRRS